MPDPRRAPLIRAAAGWPARRRRVVLAVVVAGVVLVAIAGVLLARGTGASPAYTSRDVRLPVRTGAQPAVIDATVFSPLTAGRHAAVVLVHGFGGSKADVRPQAERLAAQGFVVLTPSARGFGASTGLIGLGLPGYDGADERAEVDYLATLPSVRLDGAGDPRVALAGASYGGGLALTGAAGDARVDAVAADITWDSLASSLVPNAASAGAGRPGGAAGVFKQFWASLFFGSGASRPASSPVPCGRFVPQVCAAYAQAATSATAAPATLQLLDRASVAPALGRLRAPTLLVQGEDDTLFPLGEATRTYTALRARGVASRMVWLRGGHDSPFTGTAATRLEDETQAWLHRWLDGDASAGSASGFAWQRSDGTFASAAGYPVEGAPQRRFVLAAGRALTASGTASAQRLVNPPGGRPASLSTLPGLSALTGLAGGSSGSGGTGTTGAGGTTATGGAGFGAASSLLSDPPTQVAQWTSAPLDDSLQVVGQPAVRLRVTSSSGTAVLFAKVYQVSASGSATLVEGQVAPLRVTGVAGAGRVVDVALPTLAHTFPAGTRLRFALASTDQGFAAEQAPAVLTVEGAEPLGLPVVPLPATRVAGLVVGVLAGVAVALLALVVAALVIARNRRRAAGRLGRGDADPLVVTGLTKTYRDGHRAVDDLSFRVGRGQVVGLLGPNGAGKTTALRMVLGLITPSAGEARLFGERVGPSAPVLARVGAFVEGPGLLPHLSGRDNLELWWRSGGRDLADARLDEVLEVAGLGAAIDKPVRSYSQGMRQRVALAQALLGMPDLLILDEPTNGLDPPQIREMRDLIRRYAAEGRTVLVSSHLLSEVEVTCSHVVVVQSGRLVHAGRVDDLLARSAGVALEVDGDPEAAARLLRERDDVRSATVQDDGTIALDLGERGADARPAVVAALVDAGVGVRSLSLSHRLEDVFLGLVGASTEGHSVGSGGRG